ncbi:MAG: glycosyltransferase family 2 protein [Chthoniobacterales bacterium]
MAPYFSVITPSFNQGDFISECLRSVAQQEDLSYEHLIFDNCSTDQTATEAAKFPNVIFKSEADRGQAHAVNKGLRAAQGEIICWLNADDSYPQSLFSRLKKIFSNPEIDVIFGDALQITYDGRGDVFAPAHFESRLDLIRWWSPDVKLHQPSVFFRRSVVDEIGFLREDLHYALDYEYWWRMSEFYKFHQIHEILSHQYRQPDSKTILAWNKVLLERENIFKPFYHLLPITSQKNLSAEKSKSLQQLYLNSAFSLVNTNPDKALSLLLQIIKLNPLSIFTKNALALFKKSLSAKLRI